MLSRKPIVMFADNALNLGAISLDTGGTLVINESPILTILVGIFLLAVAFKLFHLLKVNSRAARILKQDHGLDIVRGIGGNQSGRVTPDKRLSAEALKDL